MIVIYIMRREFGDIPTLKSLHAFSITVYKCDWKLIISNAPVYALAMIYKIYKFPQITNLGWIVF